MRETLATFQIKPSWLGNAIVSDGKKRKKKLDIFGIGDRIEVELGLESKIFRRLSSPINSYALLCFYY